MRIREQPYLFGALLALVSCGVWPNDTEAQQGQCRPEAISGTGTSFPYTVMAEDSAGQWVIRSRHSREATAIDAARDSAYASPSSVYLVRSTFELRWRDRQGNPCTPPGTVPDTVVVTPPPPPPPAPPPTPPPPPPPPPPAGADTAMVTDSTAQALTVEATFADAPWVNVTARSGSQHIAPSPYLNVTSPFSLTVPRQSADYTATVAIVKYDRQPGTAGVVHLGTSSFDIVVPGTGVVTPPPPPPAPPPGPPPPPPPPGPGWDPQGAIVCDEDFTRFADWAAFMSGVRCITNRSHLDGFGRNNIDVDANGLWYRFRALPTQCGDQIVGQANVNLPTGTREVWLEWTGTFSDNFETSNPNCSSPAPDFKYVLVWLETAVSCGNRRAELKMGTTGGQITSAAPGFPQCDDAVVNGTVRVPGARTYFDGQPHVFRVAFRMLGNSQYHIYTSIDSTVTHDYVTNSIPDQGLAFDRIMMGSNRNLGATEDMFLHWRGMKVWAR